MKMIETNHCVNTRHGGTLKCMEAAVTFDLDQDEREEAPPTPRRLSYLSTSEIADCTCPEWCERDHDRD
jgi:hypothetical protein